jgi:hypothetical protein
MKHYREATSKETYHTIIIRDKQQFLSNEVLAVDLYHSRPFYGLDRDEKSWLGLSFGRHGRGDTAWKLVSGSQVTRSPGPTPFRTLYLPNFLDSRDRLVSHGLYIMKDDDDYFWASQVKAIRKDYGEMLEWRHFRCDQLPGLLEYMREARTF